MENKFLKVSKKLSAVVLGATLLCVNMQGATLQQIEAKKKAEEKAQKEAQQTLKENQVVITYDNNVIAELANDIPEDKKKMLKQAIYYANIAKGEYSKAEWGHMIDSYVIDFNYMIEPYRNIEWEKRDRERVLNGEISLGYFDGKYGFVDTCMFKTIWKAADEYKNTYSKQYSAKNYSSFNPAKFNEKKALAKWLNEVFYPYVNKLNIKEQDSSYELVKHDLKQIKKAMVIK